LANKQTAGESENFPALNENIFVKVPKNLIFFGPFFRDPEKFVGNTSIFRENGKNAENMFKNKSCVIPVSDI